MVHRNNNITQNKTDYIPVYPFTVDVSSFPERKYIFGIYGLARITYIALFIAMIFCLLSIIYAFSRKTSPKFIKWNRIENKYEYLDSNRTINNSTKTISSDEYLNQYFVQTYMDKRFSISKTIQNYNNWCDCKDKTISKMGIFNLNEECFLCKYSSPSIYKSFVDNVQNTYTSMADNGITRTIDILNIKLLRKSETNPELSIIEKFLHKTKNILITRIYKIDFIINEFRNNIQTSKDVLIGYLVIQGNKSSPQKRSVVSESYMFNPNYDLVLENLKEETNAIK